MAQRIVAVLGDYYHRADWAEGALRRALAPLPDVELRLADESALAEALEERPELVVLFKEDRVDPEAPAPRRWMDEALQRRIAAYVEDGGSWLAWHSGLASYDPEGAYVGMLRGCFLSHPAAHQWVRYVGATPEETSYELYDEHYFVACDESRTDVFLRSSSVDGASIAGWAHAFGRGRVCCYTPAHTEAALAGEDVAAALRRRIAWCLGSE